MAISLKQISGGKLAVETATVIAGAVAAVALWTGTGQGVQATGCAHLGWLRPLQSLICDLPFQTVAMDQADMAVSRFLGRSTGAVKANGWRMLTPEAQLQFPLEDFAKEWSNFAFAERVGSVEPQDGAYNTFLVHYRTYTDSGSGKESVASYSSLMRLSYDQLHEVRFALVGIPVISDIRSTAFPQVQVKESGVVSLNSPGLGSKAGPVPADTDLGLHAICDVDLGAGGWWARTEYGFIRSADLGHDGDYAAVPGCDHHYVDDYVKDASSSVQAR